MGAGVEKAAGITADGWGGACDVCIVDGMIARC